MANFSPTKTKIISSIICYVLFLLLCVLVTRTGGLMECDPPIEEYCHQTKFFLDQGVEIPPDLVQKYPGSSPADCETMVCEHKSASLLEIIMLSLLVAIGFYVIFSLAQNT